jgi:hypothetical protein
VAQVVEYLPSKHEVQSSNPVVCPEKKFSEDKFNAEKYALFCALELHNYYLIHSNLVVVLLSAFDVQPSQVHSDA